jgi:hypothetical protein
MQSILLERFESRLLAANAADRKRMAEGDREAAERMRRRLELMAALVAAFGAFEVFRRIRSRVSFAAGKIPSPKRLLEEDSVPGLVSFLRATHPNLADMVLLASRRASGVADLWWQAARRRADALASGIEAKSPLTEAGSLVAEGQVILTAWHDGVVTAARTDEGRYWCPVWRVVERMDEVTRGNPSGRYPEPHRHWQFSGYVNTIDELVRQRLVPPNGHNCRATLEPIYLSDATREGLVVGGVVSPQRIRELNGGRQTLVDSGLYPDRGYVRR